ncbi:hypothetical protein FEFB_10810 [Fructobacillus sp. EFB-N1]|uniref:hypothetical protein n=1 Tax=Fructobacillus sp. EFB-N1 TaxID=1658766 RepID=UPI00064D7814|nr:hypothetical protein [Fructobacillus sp. EFB-N1]KMK53153.1 hypothetical protein FEFB_10810 [Fructobacillus sp. EFB-N1]
MNSYVVCMSDFKGSAIYPKGLEKAIIKADSKNDAIIKFIKQIKFENTWWIDIQIKVEELGVIE